ncbi:MAG TPA: lactate utilization protein [Methylovirgula sp.]|nr:lactate utilization protein [Methylovirgula sp.]
MSARAEIFADIRRALGVTGREAPRRQTVEARLAHTPKGIVPARGAGGDGRQAVFRAEAERVLASVVELSNPAEIPTRIAAYLADRNLPLILRMGDDPFLAALPWQSTALAISQGPSDGSDPICLSHAFGAIAESGTLVLLSGPANPTTLNFLPETHVVVVKAADIVGNYEEIWQRLRAAFGKGAMPRTVNFITGPSRSADIGQTMQLGAHGPRELHIIVVEG